MMSSQAIIRKPYLVLLASLAMSVAAEAQEDSGFLSDYSLLETPSDVVGADRHYLAENAEQRLADYSGVFIEQPEIIVASDSKYKGMKPDDLKVIADAMREVVARELHGDFNVVDIPAEGVLVVRLALSNVHLEKKRRPLLAYTPIGAITHAAKKAMFDDVMDKIQLKGAVFEVEVNDAATDEVIAAAVDSRGMKGSKEEVSWDDANRFFTLVGKRVTCRLDNARLPTGQQVDCLAIQEAAAEK